MSQQFSTVHTDTLHLCLQYHKWHVLVLASMSTKYFQLRDIKRGINVLAYTMNRMHCIILKSYSETHHHTCTCNNNCCRSEVHILVLFVHDLEGFFATSYCLPQKTQWHTIYRTCQHMQYYTSLCFSVECPSYYRYSQHYLLQLEILQLFLNHISNRQFRRKR